MGSPVPGSGPVRVATDKSPVLAFVLTFFLGPLGLLYVAVVPALILLAVAVGINFAAGITSPVARAVSVAVWLVSIVWAGVEASRRHRASEAWRASTGSQGVPTPGYRQAAALSYFPGQDAPLPPPGWYPDASDATKVRWWDGNQWTGDARAPSQLPPSGAPLPDQTFPAPDA